MEKSVTEGLLFANISGSRAYGSAVEGSDVDIRGVFAGSRASILSPFYPVKNTNGAGDTLFYEFSSFLKLVTGQNPNILEIFWTDERNILFKSPIWKPITAMRESLLSRGLAKSYGGFAHEEKKRIIKVIESGKDLNIDDDLRLRKAAAHVLRILRMAHEGLASGQLKIYREESSEYIAIRNGDISIQHALKEADILEENLADAVTNSILPETISPDVISLLSEVAQDTYQGIWKQKTSFSHFPAILREAMEISTSLEEEKEPSLKKSPNLSLQRIVVVDIEKTGFRVMGLPESIELGAVELVNGKPHRTFHSWIKNEVPISKYAENLHGINSEFLDSQPLSRVVLKEFNEFVGDDSVLVFHSAENDADTLEHDMALAGLPSFERNRIHCTAKIAKALGLPKSQKGYEISLNNLCETLGVNHSLRDIRGHSALLDAHLTADCLVTMSKMKGYQSIESFGLKKTSLTTRRVHEKLKEMNKIVCWIDRDTNQLVFKSPFSIMCVGTPEYPETHTGYVVGRTYIIKDQNGIIDNPLGPAMYFTNKEVILSAHYQNGFRHNIEVVELEKIENSTEFKM